MVVTLRELWHRRWIVAIGIAIAIAGSIFVSYKVSPGKLESRQYEAGLAAAEVLVDSPRSQIVDLGGADPDEVDGAMIDIGGLSTRARLLASLMASSPLKDEIAEAARIDTRKFIVVAPTGDDLAPRVAPATGTTVKPGDRDANVLNLFVDETLPIITMRAEAPDAATAGRIAAAAVEQLDRYLKSVASDDAVPDARQLVVESLGAPTAATVTKGPRKLFAIAAGLLIFGLWCAATIMIPRLIASWRAAAWFEAAEEEAWTDEPAAPAEPDVADFVFPPVTEADRDRADEREPEPAQRD
jgi:hypothetical protein